MLRQILSEREDGRFATKVKHDLDALSKPESRTFEPSSVHARLDLPAVMSGPVIDIHKQSFCETLKPKENPVQLMAHQMTRDDLIELKVKALQFPIILEVIKIVLSMKQS
jgi:hypothetical protein